MAIRIRKSASKKLSSEDALWEDADKSLHTSRVWTTSPTFCKSLAEYAAELFKRKNRDELLYVDTTKSPYIAEKEREYTDKRGLKKYFTSVEMFFYLTEGRGETSFDLKKFGHGFEIGDVIDINTVEFHVENYPNKPAHHYVTGTVIGSLDDEDEDDDE